MPDDRFKEAPITNRRSRFNNLPHLCSRAPLPNFFGAYFTAISTKEQCKVPIMFRESNGGKGVWKKCPLVRSWMIVEEQQDLLPPWYVHMSNRVNSGVISGSGGNSLILFGNMFTVRAVQHGNLLTNSLSIKVFKYPPLPEIIVRREEDWDNHPLVLLAGVHQRGSDPNSLPIDISLKSRTTCFSSGKGGTF